MAPKQTEQSEQHQNYQIVAFIRDMRRLLKDRSKQSQQQQVSQDIVQRVSEHFQAWTCHVLWATSSSAWPPSG